MYNQELLLETHGVASQDYDKMVQLQLGLTNVNLSKGHSNNAKALVDITKVGHMECWSHKGVELVLTGGSCN